jgi:dihydroorotate dehydrogenase (NAD+) catalytic subunit
MIELAPQHKTGLSLTSPVMLASGCCGYGDVYGPLLNLAAFGAIVTQSITLRPRRGTIQPRLVETVAGFLLDTGQQNPGVRKILQKYTKLWPRLAVPIIAHLPADEPEALMRTARALAGARTSQANSIVAAIELGLPATATSQETEAWLKAIQEECELPLLVKLPLGIPFEVIEAAASASAAALVVGSSPPGTAFLSERQRWFTGQLYGPALHNLVLHEVRQVAAAFQLPLVASGGIHRQADVEAFLAAGVVAVQLDSLVFIDPRQAETVALAFRE